MLTILCLASYEKGHEFLRECKRQGARVFLLSSLSLKESAHWPAESIDEIFYMPDQAKVWNRDDTLAAVSYVARNQVIDRIVPLDDFDLEMAAALREHLRIPGMGETTTRYFRDKLAMRMKAVELRLRVPDFAHVLNHERVRGFLDRVPPPWMLKPRSMAGAIGIKKIASATEFWPIADALGDRQSHYLLERFVPGDIFHVDSIVFDERIVFATASRYGNPPMEVSHEGGIFTTWLIERGSERERALLAMNEKLLTGMGLRRGVSHSEFIQGRDGEFYFLETSARVGGANIAEMVEAATGVNLWAEWAKIELAGEYHVPPIRQDYAGLLVSLARQEKPDTSAYNDPEIVWRMNKRHHVGLIVKSPDSKRVRELIEGYAAKVRNDFHASAPAPEKPSD
ncbi:MAG: ATPase [Acidobacteriota bacterium]|nr:ATPase [Acidobacteriota bacterium]